MRICNLTPEAAARGKDTLRRKAQGRRDANADRFEKAKAAQDAGLLEKHCEQIREERGGIPLGLWAVVMKDVRPRDVGAALVSGHSELLEPVA